MTTTTKRVRRDNFSAAEVAAANGINRNTVYQLTYTGELNAVRIGRAVRIPRAELERLGWAVPQRDEDAA